MAGPVQAPRHAHDETPEIVTDLESRQGPKGRPVLMVLVASLFLAGIYLVSLLVWSGNSSPPTSGAANPPMSSTSTLPQNPNPPPPEATGSTK